MYERVFDISKMTANIDTVGPRLSGLVGTTLNSPDNRGSG